MLKSAWACTKNTLNGPAVLAKLSTQEISFNYHWPQCSERYFAVCDILPAWCRVPDSHLSAWMSYLSPVFLFLEAALQWIWKVFPLPSRLVIIPLQLAIRQLSGIQLSPSNACEQSSRTLLCILASPQDCGRTSLPTEDGELKNQGSYNKTQGWQHSISQQGMVPAGDTDLILRDNMHPYFYSISAPRFKDNIEVRYASQHCLRSWRE